MAPQTSERKFRARSNWESMCLGIDWISSNIRTLFAREHMRRIAVVFPRNRVLSNWTNVEMTMGADQVSASSSLGSNSPVSSSERTGLSGVPG